MRFKSVLSFFLLAFSATLFAQQPVNHEWAPNEVLVRFADHLKPSVQANGKIGVADVDAVLADFSVAQWEQLFRAAPELPSDSGFTTYAGEFVRYPKLSNIYRYVLTPDSLGTKMFDMIDAFRALGPEYVVYAEPNFYRSSIGSTLDFNDTLYDQQWSLAAIQADTVIRLMQADTTISDTTQVIAIIDTGVDRFHEDLQSKMWKNMAEVNGVNGVDDDQNGYVDDKFGWDFINNDGDPMDDNSHGTHCAGIAAAETDNELGMAGVSPGARIMGVKVLQSGGYGTASQVAQGILYAANNGATVINMSLGSPAASMVEQNALAVAYAYSFLVAAAGNNGLCIGKPDPTYKCPDGKTPKPFYPAAYSYVLGVESSAPSGAKSSFSNYDEDGPLSSAYPALLNYEVRAPGSQIISAIPAGNTGNNGRYAVKQGTSMAAPAVAGAVSLLQTFKPTFTHEKTFLHLIHSQTNNIKLLDAITMVLAPQMDYVSYQVVDTIDGDVDAAPDAGETIELVVGLKNIGGYNDSVWASIELDPLEDTTLVQFIQPVRFYGSVSEYAVIQNNVPSMGIHPFVIKLDSNIAHGRGIKFKVNYWTNDGTFSGSKGFELRVQNGVEFQAGFYPGTTVLRPNTYYVVTGNTIFDTLVVKPGTQVYVEYDKSIGAKKITAIGTPDSMITFEGVQGLNWRGLEDLDGWRTSTSTNTAFPLNSQSRLRYAYYRNVNVDLFTGIKLYEMSNVRFEYCSGLYGVHILRNQGGIGNSTQIGTFNGGAKKKFRYTIAAEGQNTLIFSRNIIENCRAYVPTLTYYDHMLVPSSRKGVNLSGDSIFYVSDYSVDSLNSLSGYNLYANQIFGGSLNPNDDAGWFLIEGPRDFSNTTILGIKSNNYPFGRSPVLYMRGPKVPSLVTDVKGMYLGGVSTPYLNLRANDYFDNSTLSIFNTSLVRKTAPRHAHGFVVDMKINGKSTHWMDNPYNGPQGTGILGNGRHKVSVQFNRPMDTSKTPFVTFGVREPWTQNTVADSAYWSDGNTVFHAYMNINVLTQSDGVNRMSVRLAYDDEHFEAPTENERFEFRLASTGSLSAGFAAEGDTGRINLNWGKPVGVDDFLGFNMYRIDSTYFTTSGKTPVFVYNKMNLDSTLVDSTVAAGKYYGYFFKVVRTNLSEMDASDTVWARPWQGRPTVLTLVPSAITSTTVTLNGRVTPNYLVTQARFNHGLLGQPGTNTTYVNKGSGSAGVLHSVNLTGLQPGTTYRYRVEASNSEGVASGQDVQFTTRFLPQLKVRWDSTLCANDSLKINNLTASIPGGLSYQWEVRTSSNQLVAVSSSAAPRIRLAQSGTFSVKVTVSGPEATTVVKTGTVSVDANPTPLVTASGATSFCPGGSVTLTANSGFAGYAWSTGALSASIQATQAGSYHVVATSPNGCQGTSAPVVVSLYSAPTAVVSVNGPTVLCTGQSTQLTAPAGMTAYAWSQGGSLLAGQTSSTLVTAQAGTYTLSVTNGQGCSSTSAPLVVTASTTPSAAVSASGALTFCAGDSVVLSAPLGAGLQYTWVGGGTSRTKTVKGSGTYTVSVSNSNGCSATSAPVTVTVYAVPVLTAQTVQTPSLCPGGTVNALASAGFASYSWSNGAQGAGISIAQPGTYTVVATTAEGCVRTSNSVVVTAGVPATAAVVNTGAAHLCNGATATLQAPAGAGWTYLWNNGATTQTLATTQAGLYSVTVTSNTGCVAQSTPVAITASSITAPTVQVSGPTALCPGTSVQLTAAGNFASTTWSNGVTAQSINVTAPGTYSAVVADAAGCTATTNSVVVTAGVPATAAVVNTGVAHLCNGATTTLQAPAGAGWTYLWSNGSTGQTLATGQAGLYSVTVTSNTGCVAQSTPVAITASSITAPTVQVSGPTALCPGTSVQLTAAGNFASTTWSNGVTAQSININAPGTYSAVVADAAGCTATTNSVVVTAGAAANAAATLVGNATLCPGQTAQIQVPAGQGQYAWYRNGVLLSGQQGNQLTVATSGTYHAVVTSVNGCAATGQPVSVAASSLIAPTVQISGPSALCPGAQTTLQASGNYAFLLWNTGAVGAQTSVNTAGSYWATATDALGCTVGTDTLVVTAAAPAAASIAANGPTAFCAGQSTVLSAGSTMAGYQWYWNGLPLAGETDSVVMATAAGSYRVGTTSADGCSALSAPLAVVVNALPATPAVSYSNVANWLLSSAPSGNQWYLNGVLIPGADSTVWQPLQNGIYTVEVTNADGCTAVSSPYNYVNLGLENGANALNLRVQPNPASDRTVLVASQPLDGAVASVVDALGRVVWSDAWPADAAQMNLNVSHWAKGMYRVTVEMPDARVVLPLVVQ